MQEVQPFIILEDDVYSLTAGGETELSGAGTSLSTLDLQVLVLIDGRSTAGETAARIPGMDPKAVVEVLRKLLRSELIELVQSKGGSLDFVNFFKTKRPVEPPVGATAVERQFAEQTASLLQQQGYVVRIVRRTAGRRAPSHAAGFSILVIEDDPTIAKLLRQVLEDQGFDVNAAKNREEISAGLGRQPRPDLVLLDLMLPDVDGFEVLLRIREHPALKTLPVVILTGQATRGAVLKGLAGGADGYITKPFVVPVLLKAVQTVLGLSEA